MTEQIERLQTFAVDYPADPRFKFFERRASQSTAVRPTIVVKLTAGNGTVGWGQCVPSRRWSYETPESVRSTIEIYLAPELIGHDAHDIVAAHGRMNRAIAPSFSTGQPIAKAGVDLALHDLAGRLAARSVMDDWGRAPSATVPLSWTINVASLDLVAAEVERAVELGYRSFNIKVAPDVEFDLESCRLVRQLAPEAHVWVDANGGYDVTTALSIAPRLAELGIAAFEQPVPANQLRGFRALKQQGALPILMDEGIVSRTDLEEFVALDLLDGVTMKVARSGGLSQAVEMLRLVEDVGLMWLGSGLTDPDLSLAASLALFAAFGAASPAALNAPQYLTTSILAKPIVVVGGECVLPRGRGLGVEVNERQLQI